MLTDNTGKTYLDCESGVWSTCLGYNHPDINRVLTRQCAQLMHMSYRFGCEVVNRTAQDLLEVTGLKGGKCVFLTSGSEAVHLAMRLAQAATRRNRWLVLEPSYLAAYGEGDSRHSQNWIVVERDAIDLDDTIPWNEIAGFVFEPGSAAGRVVFPETSLVAKIVQRIHDHGGVVIAEEVTTGMGRTGEWFACNHYNLQPDIVAVGKGLGSGYPVSAVAVNTTLSQAIENTGLHYVQSHQNDPLGCAVASEVIRVLKQDNLIAQGKSQGRLLRDQLLMLKSKYPLIKDVRGKGLMCAVEFHTRIQAGDIFESMLEHGILVGCNPENNLIRFMPPLVIGTEEIERIVSHLGEVIVERQL